MTQPGLEPGTFMMWLDSKSPLVCSSIFSLVTFVMLKNILTSINDCKLITSLLICILGFAIDDSELQNSYRPTILFFPSFFLVFIYAEMQSVF